MLKLPNVHCNLGKPLPTSPTAETSLCWWRNSSCQAFPSSQKNRKAPTMTLLRFKKLGQFRQFQSNRTWRKLHQQKCGTRGVRERLWAHMRLGSRRRRWRTRRARVRRRRAVGALPSLDPVNCELWKRIGRSESRKMGNSQLGLNVNNDFVRIKI